jgi:transposase-like protein
MKTLENLTVRLLKEETLMKIFLEQDTSDKAFYSSRGRSFNKSNVKGESSTSFSNPRQNCD